MASNHGRFLNGQKSSKATIGLFGKFSFDKKSSVLFEMILDIPARRYETDVDVAVVAAVVIAAAAVVVVDIAAVAEGLKQSIF